MDVFLLPVGADAYEPYCEHIDEPEVHDEAPPTGRWAIWKFFVRVRIFGRLKARFQQVLAEAERERRRESVTAATEGWWPRAKRRAMRFVAESIAEQRLLWNLRRHLTATLNFPDDMPEEAAVAILRRQLARDFDKHRFWLIIDSLGFVGSGLLFLIPGPNILAYYFAFRIVGHYLSLRGARQGLDTVTWTHEQSPPLSELRRAIGLDAEERTRRVHDIADALNLEDLAKFFERTAEPTS